MTLLVDIGNSRIKWGVKGRCGIVRGAAFPLRNEPLQQAFDQAWGLLERPERVVVSNVAGTGVGKALGQWIRRQWRLDVETVQVRQEAYGVTIAYRDPRRFGVDRWLCLIALRHSHSLPACVVDCGTAITLDLLDVSGLHRGGVIMPGIELMKRSLLKGTSGIVIDSPGKVPVGLSDNTGAGIESGVVLAVAGMVEKLLRQQAVGTTDKCKLILTGGDADRVAAQLSEPAVVVPDLVLQGLAVMI